MTETKIVVKGPATGCFTVPPSVKTLRITVLKTGQDGFKSTLVVAMENE